MYQQFKRSQAHQNQSQLISPQAQLRVQSLMQSRTKSLAMAITALEAKDFPACPSSPQPGLLNTSHLVKREQNLVGARPSHWAIVKGVPSKRQQASFSVASQPRPSFQRMLDDSRFLPQVTPKAIQERACKTVMKRRDLNCFKLPPRQDFDATGIPISIQQFARLVASPGNRNNGQ